MKQQEIKTKFEELTQKGVFPSLQNGWLLYEYVKLQKGGIRKGLKGMAAKKNLNTQRVKQIIELELQKMEVEYLNHRLKSHIVKLDSIQFWKILTLDQYGANVKIEEDEKVGKFENIWVKEVDKEGRLTGNNFLNVHTVGKSKNLRTGPTELCFFVGALVFSCDVVLYGKVERVGRLVERRQVFRYLNDKIYSLDVMLDGQVEKVSIKDVKELKVSVLN